MLLASFLGKPETGAYPTEAYYCTPRKEKYLTFHEKLSTDEHPSLFCFTDTDEQKSFVPLAVWARFIEFIPYRNKLVRFQVLVASILFGGKLIGATTFSITTLSIMTFSITINKSYTQLNDTQHNDTQHNDTQHNDTHHNDTQHKCT